MKKITRILSLALVAMMVLSLAAVAQAETPSVYIPGRLAKLVDAVVDDYVWPALATKGDTVGGKERLNTEGVMHFQFSEKPDWFGATVSSLDGGWISIDIDDSGYGELELEGLHRQPGMYSWVNTDVTYWKRENGSSKLYFRKAWDDGNGNAFKKDDAVPAKYFGWLYGNGGDYPYYAGKDYGDYNVTVSYHRNGGAYQVAVTLKNTDLFETGMEGAATTITFTLVNVELDSYTMLAKDIVWDNDKEAWKYDGAVRPNNKYVKTTGDGKRISMTDDNHSWMGLSGFQVDGTSKITYKGEQWEYYKLSNTNVWYVSSVSATYPEGNSIVAVEADFKNDAKNNLCQYKVSFAVNENDVAEIYYKPWDSPFYGQYYRNGSIIAVSGSGNNLNKWYKYNGNSENVTLKKQVFDKNGNYLRTDDVPVQKVNNNGKQVKTIKKGINSYKSPRVTTK